MSTLIDTGFLFAVIDADDNLHASCVTALRSERNALLPNVVLPELAYLILRDLGYAPLNEILRSISSGQLQMIDASLDDLERAAELLEKFADSKVDFVDCVLAAMAERLNIKKILTVDRRHFQLFRPTHCSHFEIAP